MPRQSAIAAWEFAPAERRHESSCPRAGRWIGVRSCCAGQENRRQPGCSSDGRFKRCRRTFSGLSAARHVLELHGRDRLLPGVECCHEGEDCWWQKPGGCCPFVVQRRTVPLMARRQGPVLCALLPGTIVGAASVQRMATCFGSRHGRSSAQVKSLRLCERGISARSACASKRADDCVDLQAHGRP